MRQEHKRPGGERSLRLKASAYGAVLFRFGKILELVGVIRHLLSREFHASVSRGFEA
jgi:hypothetical protein